MLEDPRAVLSRGPMAAMQVLIVVLCIALNALDGFDVLAISFASPGIAAEWHIDRAVLGIVLSMELIGMAAGSVLIGQVADRIGRRPTILTCLVLMSAGMLLASVADGVRMLSLTRLLTGLGIGGMLAATSAMVAEFASEPRRNLCATLNIAGYSVGAIVGGLIASALLEHTANWRSVFVFGGTLTAVLLPITYLFLPESVEYLIARRPADAVARINQTLARLKLSLITTLPPLAETASRGSFRGLFSPRYAPLTLLLTLAYFAQIMSFYYVLKWIPKIVVDLGFPAGTAGRVLVCASTGALLGAIAMGLMSQRFALRPAIIAAMLGGFVMIAIFGTGPRELARLAAFAGLIGFFTNAAVVGLYPIFARTFPAEMRASGTGFAIGVGRGGSALGPILAGALFAHGSSLLTVSLVMGSGTLVAALLIFALPWADARGRAHS